MSLASMMQSFKKFKSSQIGLESKGVVFGEAVSMAVSFGVVAIADAVAPETQKKIYKTLGKIVFEPFLDTLETGLSTICRLEECKVDKTKSREERAEQWARSTVVFSAAWVTAMLAKKHVRSWSNTANKVHVGDKTEKWWHFNNHEQVIFGMDEGAHIGSLVLMNTVAAPVTDHMIRGMKKTLVNCGFSERKAQELSDLLVIWELPNFLGLASGMAGVNGIHNHQWDKKWGDFKEKKLGIKQTHVERLEHAVGDGMIPTL